MSLQFLNNEAAPSTKPGRKTTVRLHDIEEQLEMAESRCNTLKDQLDQMKVAYGTKRGGKSRVSVEKMSGNGSVLLDENRNPSATPADPKCTTATVQKSCQIGTDTSGAAVRTINNILNGITNSVNRLVEIQSPEVPRLRIPNSPRKKPTIKTHKSNTVAGLDQKSTVGIRKRILSRFQSSRNNKIVELYHNEAAVTRRSDSDMCLKSRQHLTVDSQQTYALPTVASKMKQVAKSYLHTINLRTIPFCAAISTTQSHNIGINIQQVMNIIKNRQPINGISPTLAHNIGLAAEKLNSRPFAAFVSNINSRLSQNMSKCPLLNGPLMNVPALQEQARNLPEAIQEADEDCEESPQMTSMFITGPSGDVEIKTKKTTTWKNPQVEQCTCAPAEYHQSNRNVVNQSQVVENKSKKRLKRSKSTKNGKIQAEETGEKDENGREKDLREVLGHLHRDFEQLNQKYENLCQKSANDNNESTIRELEKLETELNKKEEEIAMVMALCKEVQALKAQVKQLKDKRSQASLPSRGADEGKFKNYNHPEAAFHLTRLLQQIQHYQMRYKSNLEQD